MRKEGGGLWDGESAKIVELTLEMMRLVVESLTKGMNALVDRDELLGDEVITGDKRVDDLEFEIEEACINALRRDRGEEDARAVIGLSKIITDLERIGDYSVHVAEAAKILANKPLLKPLIDLPRMSKDVCEMISLCEEALRTRDASRVMPIWELDAEVDALYDQVFRELLTYILETPRLITNALYLIQVARHLERAGDHATNVGERIIYVIRGEKVKRGRAWGGAADEGDSL
ncbi:MAG: Phosphate-specific transport system accessory protein PhoU [Synergistales bacterium 54_24]|nr:MAG: Phosphate-specific transport system accessory protein PhoU [Synergistales bacterium 54_24]